MVFGALYVRGTFIDAEGDGILTPDEPVRLVCAAELRPVCEAVRSDAVTVRSEEAGQTAAALTAPDTTNGDLWLTLAPWPTIVTEARQRATLEPLADPDVQPLVLGRSPLVLVVAQERAAVLARHCRDTDFSWGCIGRVAAGTWQDAGGQRAWGRIKPAHADPTTNATGLLVLGQAVSDFLGRAQFSTRDLDDDELLTWLTNLEQAVPRGTGLANSPLEQKLQFGPARFDVVGTTEAEAGPLLERSADRAQGLIMRPAKPLVVAEVVLAPLRPGEQERFGDVVEPLKAALAAAGWVVEGEPLAAGVGATPLPDDAGIPPAGALDALRTRVEEIR